MGIKYQLGNYAYFVVNLLFGISALFALSGSIVFYTASLLFITCVLIYLMLNNISLIWLNFSLKDINSDDILEEWVNSKIHWGDTALCLSIIIISIFSDFDIFAKIMLFLLSLLSLMNITLTIRRILNFIKKDYK